MKSTKPINDVVCLQYLYKGITVWQLYMYVYDTCHTFELYIDLTVDWQSESFCGSIDISPDGMKAIVTLSSGDMRRSLNILQVSQYITLVITYHYCRRVNCTKCIPPVWFQSTNMAYGKVTEDTVYTCTGHPLRSDIANILDWSLNKDFTTAYKRILHLASSFRTINSGSFAVE